MSISASFNSALSGLSATSKMAEIVSNNLSNALTEGYGKREVLISSARLGGVQVDGVVRSIDPVILGERRLADAGLANSERFAGTLGQVEIAVGTADDGFGLAARLTAVETALVSASADPSSEQRLGLVVSRLGDFTDALSEATRRVQILRQEADASIAKDVENLNISLRQVEELNKAIAKTRTTGGDVNSLIDARQNAVDKIASIVPIREISRPNEGIALISKSGLVLLDGPAVEFSFEATPTIVADMELSNGVLGGIMVNGSPIDPSNGFGRLEGGSLSASFELRDTQLTQSQLRLDEVAADMITRFEQTSVDPSLSVSDTGLLTDNGNRFDSASITGLAGRISVNSAIDQSGSGELWRLRDGLAASTQGPVGDASQINRWIDSLSMSFSYQVGGPERSASGQLGNAISEISSSRLRADEALSFETAKWNLLKDAELAGGVDSDTELQNLIQIEQAYSANAKLIQTATAMLRTLMEI